MTQGAQQATGDAAVLAVEELEVTTAATRAPVVQGVSFEVAAGEVLGLVGESGSGKTTLSLALMGYARRGLSIRGGQVRILGRDMIAADNVAELRGTLAAYVAQDPGTALNPALKIGMQLNETLDGPADDKEQRLHEVLEDVDLNGRAGLLDAYPHQLSGGQQQRVMIAMALIRRPRLLILDEPTTGLDVSTQRQVLSTVRSLCTGHRIAAVYVSHDLAAVADIADTVGVMYAGRLVELVPSLTAFSAPAHPYTRGLLRAIPSPTRAHVLEGIPGRPPPPGHRPSGCAFAPRCSFRLPACEQGLPDAIPIADSGHWSRCLRAAEIVRQPPLAELPERDHVEIEADATNPLLSINRVSAGHGGNEVLRGIDASVQKGSCLAIVGESGAGKTTLARSIVGLHSEWAGSIRYKGHDLPRSRGGRDRDVLRSIQYIFQNPYNSLNPRKTVGQLVEQPLKTLSHLSRHDRTARARQALEDAALSSDYERRYPDELSGGERQRVAIARALGVGPDVLVCDEITSALDVSVQAAIVELLRGLQVSRSLTLILITHDLSLVRSLADDVLILHRGRVVERGPDALDRPQSEYAIKLLADTPGVALS